MSDDANDVTKALAAFGAPTLRYHSFGQAQIRPSGRMNTRPAAATVPPGEADVAMTQQSEPVAAREMLPPRLESYQAPLTAPVRGEIPPAPLFSAMPTIAPPPRPLAEWAAPVGPAPAPKVAPPMPAPASRDIAVSDGGVMTPASPPAPPPNTPVIPDRAWAVSPPPPPLAVAPPAASASHPTVATPAMHGAGRSLAEVFEFLAA